MSDPVDPFHQSVLDMADFLELDDDEREEYVGYHLSRKGYQQTSGWAPPAEEQGSGRRQGGGFMAGSQQRGRQPQPQQKKPAAQEYFRGKKTR
jgi:hypothetical protein